MSYRDSLDDLQDFVVEKTGDKLLWSEEYFDRDSLLIRVALSHEYYEPIFRQNEAWASFHRFLAWLTIFCLIGIIIMIAIIVLTHS